MIDIWAYCFHDRLTINILPHCISAGLKGQKIVMANKIGATGTSGTVVSSGAATTSNAIRIVKVGNQAKKTIAIMPSASIATSVTSNSSSIVSSQESLSLSDSRSDLKRKLAEAEESAKRFFEEYEMKKAEAERLRQQLEQDQENVAGDATATVEIQ